MPEPPDPTTARDDDRPRPERTPASGERLDDLARSLAEGTYRVRPDLVAEAMLRRGWGRPGRRD